MSERQRIGWLELVLVAATLFTIIALLGRDRDNLRHRIEAMENAARGAK